MGPEQLIDYLSKEINSALRNMSRTKDIKEKEVYSRIIKNLCESQGVFLKFASDMMSQDFEDDDFDDDMDEEGIPF
jgi:hypothetical protein